MLPHRASADTAALEAGARKEATLTWYIAQVDTDTAEVMGRAFTKQYPGINVQVIRTTGQVAYQRLMQDLKNNSPQCDVFSTTDIAHMPALMKRNALANFTPDNAASLGAAFKGLGQDGYWYPNHSTLMLIIANTQRVKPPGHAERTGRTCWTRNGKAVSPSAIPPSPAMSACGRWR